MQSMYLNVKLSHLCREMVLQWTTADTGTPTAKLGTAPGNYSITATGNSSTYLPADLF